MTEEHSTHVVFNELSELLLKVESVDVKKPISAHSTLSCLEAEYKELGRKLDTVHEHYRKSPTGNISGPGFAMPIIATQVTSQGLSYLMQLERLYQSVGSSIDRKNSYTFGYISLYVALISLVLGSVGMVF